MRRSTGASPTPSTEATSGTGSPKRRSSGSGVSGCSRPWATPGSSGFTSTRVTQPSPSFASLFDRQLPGWREDPAMLRRAFGLGDEDLLAAHRAAKLSLLQEVE